MTVSLTSCPAVRRRGPPPTSTHRPYGEGHHRTRGLGPLWREGAPGAARPQDRHHLQRPTPWPSRRWPPGSPEASGDEWLHRASNRWRRIRSLAWANAASAVRYGSVSWHAVEVNIGDQEDLPRPPMRTSARPAYSGRWSRSVTDRSPTEPFAVDGVAVSECCTASSLASWGGGSKPRIKSLSGTGPQRFVGIRVRAECQAPPVAVDPRRCARRGQPQARQCPADRAPPGPPRGGSSAPPA